MATGSADGGIGLNGNQTRNWRNRFKLLMFIYHAVSCMAAVGFNHHNIASPTLCR